MSTKPATTLPAFAPVPRQTRKLTGWTPEVQQAFIEALAECGSVHAACRIVNRSDNGAYQLRRHPEAREFRKAWDAALDIAVRRLEDEAMHRALNGTEEQHTYHDKVVVRRRFNDRLLMFLLRNRAPKRFAAGGHARGLSGLDKMRLKQFKKEWRAEWDEEQRRAEPDIEEVRAEILRKVAVLDADRRRRWSPREERLHNALAEECARREAREAQQKREAFARMTPQGFRRNPAEPAPPQALPPPAEDDD